MSDKDKVKTPSNLGKILPLSLGIGFLFGFALEKGRVFEPSVITDQMLMRRFQMVKMFLSAVSSSVLSMVVLSKIPSTKKYFTHARAFIYSPSRPGYLATITGATMLGIGMSICGACPGTVLVQMGAGVRQAPFVIIGGIIAGGIFANFINVFSKFTKKTPLPKEHKSVDKLLGVSYTSVALPLVGALVSVVGVLEYFFPWVSELDAPLGEASSLMAMKAWPPYIAGMIVGLLNIPTMLLLTVSIGSATSYQICAIHITKAIKKELVEKSSYMKMFLAPIAFWQPTYLIGAVLGACTSAMLSGSFQTTPSLSMGAAFLGGFVLILGSRIAGGCTSGHGISGFSFLQTISFLAIPAMFAGGIASAFLLKSIGFYGST